MFFQIGGNWFPWALGLAWIPGPWALPGTLDPESKGEGPWALGPGSWLGPGTSNQDFPALGPSKNNDFPEVLQALASNTIVFPKDFAQKWKLGTPKMCLTAYSIKSEIFGTRRRRDGIAVTDPVPEAPSSCAGGHDDGSYTNSLKLHIRLVDIYVRFIMYAILKDEY